MGRHVCKLQSSSGLCKNSPPHQFMSLTQGMIGGYEVQDNDIVLCDGPCNRGYHEACLVPEFSAPDIDSELNWLCPACHTKVRPGHMPAMADQGLSRHSGGSVLCNCLFGFLSW